MTPRAGHLARLAAATALILAPLSSHAAGQDDWLARVERSRQRCAAFVGAAVERHARTVSPRLVAAIVEGGEGLMNDPTLRYGDIIVQADRLVVFRGTPGAERTAADFRDVAAERLGGVHDLELQALDALARFTRAGG